MQQTSTDESIIDARYVDYAISRTFSKEIGSTKWSASSELLKTSKHRQFTIELSRKRSATWQPQGERYDAQKDLS